MAVPSRADRILLAVSYILLVSLVAWLGWDVDRRVADVKEAVCLSAFSIVLIVESTVDEPFSEAEEEGLLKAFSDLDRVCEEVTLPNE